MKKLFIFIALIAISARAGPEQDGRGTLDGSAHYITSDTHLTTNLVQMDLWYPLDNEISGTNFIDYSLLTNNGVQDTESARPLFNPEYGGYFHFDDVDDHIDIPNPDALSNHWGTVHVWMRSTNDSQGCLVSFSDGTLDNTWRMLVGPTTGSFTNELVTVIRRIGGVNNIKSYLSSDRTELFDGEWHSLAIRTSETSTKVVIDGLNLDVDNGAGDEGNFTTFPVLNAGIGAATFNSNNFFSGDIADVWLASNTVPVNVISNLFDKGRTRYDR